MHILIHFHFPLSGKLLYVGNFFRSMAAPGLLLFCGWRSVYRRFTWFDFQSLWPFVFRTSSFSAFRVLYLYSYISALIPSVPAETSASSFIYGLRLLFLSPPPWSWEVVTFVLVSPLCVYKISQENWFFNMECCMKHTNTTCIKHRNTPWENKTPLTPALEYVMLILLGGLLTARFYFRQPLKTIFW